MENIMNDFYVSSVEHSATYDYIINKHYAHRLPSITYAFGLFKKTDNTAYMCGICTFGRPVSHILIKNSFRGGYTDRFYELNRLCVDDGLPKNTLSFFCITMFETATEANGNSKLCRYEYESPRLYIPIYELDIYRVVCAIQGLYGKRNGEYAQCISA